jgi:hypothetical protein
MRNFSLTTVAAALLLGSAVANAVPLGAAFTYQGRLHDGGAPATGYYDLQFTLLDGPCPGGTAVGSPSTVTLAAAPVTNGLFTVSLDFGASVFDGNARWLQIQVKTNLAPSYATLSPCQELQPSPYAIYAGRAGSAASAATIPWSGLTGVAAGPGLTLTGSGFSLDTTYTDSRYDSRYWKLDGNGGTIAGPNFLGTSDNQPLVVKTAGAEAVRVAVGGNVGVGTAAPVNKLHVAGSAVFQGPDPWIDVRAYGAKGDGVTDDTVALLTALAAVPPSGAVVFAPPGTYLVSQELALRSGTTLRGAGTATVFKRAVGLYNVFVSEFVTNVTAEEFSIDMNGDSSGVGNDQGTGLKFGKCANLRIWDLRILDSTGLNVCCRQGILVRGGNHVWIERNLLTEGSRIKAGGVGDKLVVAENMLEDANDSAITIVQENPDADTINYIIRNNVVKRARLHAITIGDDGPALSDKTNRVFQNIIVDGNLLLGPLQLNNPFISVNLGTKTERLHIVNNILVNVGPRQPATSGILVKLEPAVGPDTTGPGADFLIANNSLDGAFDVAGIWIASTRSVRIINNQITYNGTNVPSHYGIWVGRGVTGGEVAEAVIQGNLVRGCHIGLAIEKTTKLQAIGNVFTDMVGTGILLSTAANTDQISAQLMGNIVSGTTKNFDAHGEGIWESGPGIFDTQYLFNDLRDNAGGPFFFDHMDPTPTRLGNRGTDEYIQRHSSGTNTWDPPNVSNAASTSTTLSVSGAALGDTVAVGFSEPLPAGALLTGAVTAANTVTVTLANLTGGDLNLNPGTVRADVWKH